MYLRVLSCLLGVAFCVSITGCDVDVEGETRLPTVDVEPGELPDVDVRGPDVDVDTEKVEVTVPDIDVDIPGEHEKEVDASKEDDLDGDE